MKKTFLLLLLTMATIMANAQGKPKPKSKQAPPSQKEMQAMMKEMEAEMKDLSPEEQASLKEMMKGMMNGTPASNMLPTAGFTTNEDLIPKRNAARLAKLSKTPLTATTQRSHITSMRTKLEARMPAADKALLAKVLTKAITPARQMEAAAVALLNGQRTVAMALSFRALQAEPANPGFLNNTAAILSQSGYPEQAIPLLRRLQTAMPDNSTVLHNLGFAWLQLGELDSAQHFFAGAAVRNPNNPETKFCQGVIEEIKGDPKKATELLEEAFALSPDDFTADALKHLGEEKPGELMTFDELKKRITIHEYFPKDWIRMPRFVNSVANYDDNVAKLAGYEIMFDSLINRVRALSDASAEEVNELIEKDFQTFSTTMFKEMQAGMNPLSKTALYISTVIIKEHADWAQQLGNGRLQLQERIEAMRKAIVTRNPNDKCEAMERKDNAYMEAINPVIDSFFKENLERMRQLLNAHCTWRPYLVGNPKNTVLTELLSLTESYIEMHREAVSTFVLWAPSCKPPKRDGVYPVPEPEIPNLLCKAKVSLPAGKEAMDLSTSTADNPLPNPFGITPSKSNPMPNVMLTYGLNPRVVGEPGKHNRPYAKVSGGNVSASFHTAADEELTPLTKISDPLTPLDPTLLPPNKKAAAELENQSDAAISRNLLKQYSQRPCNEKKKFVLGIASLEFEVMIAWDPMKNEWVKLPDDATLDDYKDSYLQFVASTMSPEAEAKMPDAYDAKKPFILGVGTLEIEDLPTPPAPAPPKQAAERQIGQIVKDGIRTVIVNGLDAGIRVGQAIRALFD